MYEDDFITDTIHELDQLSNCIDEMSRFNSNSHYAFIVNKPNSDSDNVYSFVKVINIIDGPNDTVKYEVKLCDQSGDDTGKPSITVNETDLFLIENTKVLDEIWSSLPPSDLIKLTHVSKPCILETLRVRFVNDHIYTNVGPILVAMNPFKWIKGLYSESIMNDYMKGKYDDNLSNHPHVFSISYSSYLSLCKDNKDQSILVSGESGSGE